MRHRLVFLGAITAFILCLCPISTAELLLYYDFEQQAGDIVPDHSGNAMHGTRTHVNWSNPDWDTAPQYVTSHDGSTAMRFGYTDAGTAGGAYNYIKVGSGYNETLAKVGSGFTMAFWARQDLSGNSPWGPSYGPAYPRIISCPNYEIELGAGDNGDPASYFWPFNADPAWPSPLSWDMTMANNPQDAWFHMLLRYDGTTFTQYINGTPVFSNDQMVPFNEDTWNVAYSTAPLTIGTQCYPIEKSFLVGLLDDIAIWNEAIDPNDVNDIMNGDYFLSYHNPVTIGVPEDDTPITYIWDPSFIIRYNNGQVVLGYDQKAPGLMSWNWQMAGLLTDPNFYGLVNAGLWDGNAETIEYAGFCTIGDNITQVALGRRAFKDIKYEFKARVGGENAVGNIVGVKFYRVDADAPYGNDVLIADIKTTIAANSTWYELSTFYTSTADDDNMRFKAVCYVAGPGRGTKFGYFDYVRIDPSEFLTCDARVAYNFGSSGLARDFNNDCHVNLPDFNVVAQDWDSVAPPEPSINTGELLTNSDFYADLAQVPNNNDSAGVAPTGWQFVPATTNPDYAGIWNLDRNGIVSNQPEQPAGGSVVAYIDPNTVLQQAINSPAIQNGQTYYVTAMVAGSTEPYLSMLTMTLQVVDNPVSPASVVDVASTTFIMPELLVWRQITAQYTADASAAGKYLRLKFDYGPNPFPGSTAAGYSVIGKASITTVKPDTWPRTNLLVNGDFEDYSSLPMGTNTNDGWLDLFSYVTHWTSNSIPGWDASSNAMWYYGLQCMLWAPAPQPAAGRVSAWFADKIEQLVETEAIQNGQTYYVDFIASINNGEYQSGNKEWPDTDPNMVLDVFWLAADQNDLSGVEGVDWGLITSLQDTLIGPLTGNVSHGTLYGPWVSPATSFTADASLAGKSFFVRAYCNNAAVDYPTFEEIYISKEPRPQTGPYTCYEQRYVYGLATAADLDGDCSVDVDDLLLFVDNWLACNDPAGCD